MKKFIKYLQKSKYFLICSAKLYLLLFNTNHHLYCQDCYFSKLFVFKIINNFAVIKLRGFLIGF